MTAYPTLEHRIASGYLAMFPHFYPLENAEISVEEQRTFYDLMNRLFHLIAEEPELLLPTLHEDDAYPSRYKKAYGKPELDKTLLKIEKGVKDLLKAMYLMGRGEAVKLSRRQANVLQRAGLADAGSLPPAWTWMATRPGADPVAFAYCLFDKAHGYTADVYSRLLDEPFRQLLVWLEEHGYRAFDMYNTEWPDYRLTLSIANPAWGEGRPSPGNEYKIRHTGISAQYDAYVREPASFGLCIPGGMKPWLTRFADAPAPVQAFILERTKRCNGCRYCVQTDKTGKRPLAAMTVAHGGQEYRLCPYYPGWNYAWTRVEEGLVESVIGMLEWMDSAAVDALAK